MQIATARRSFGATIPSTAAGRKALLIAAVLGLLAALLSWQYVQRAGSGSRAGTVPVLVAATDIPVRTTVTAQMLTVKQVAADARHEKALTSVEQIAGKVTNLPISAGEQVLSTKFFARKEDSGLAFRVPLGKRAVSVNISEVIGTGGLIMPGDFIDVISIFASSTSNGEPAQDSAAIVLQNIEVLAIAQSLNGPAVDAQGNGITSSVTGGQKQETIARPNARTATLAVTPEEAQKLILAEEKGKIRLALRAVEDHDTLSVPATRLSAIKGS